MAQNIALLEFDFYIIKRHLSLRGLSTHFVKGDLSFVSNLSSQKLERFLSLGGLTSVYIQRSKLSSVINTVMFDKENKLDYYIATGND